MTGLSLGSEESGLTSMSRKVIPKWTDQILFLKEFPMRESALNPIYSATTQHVQTNASSTPLPPPDPCLMPMLRQRGVALQLGLELLQNCLLLVQAVLPDRQAVRESHLLVDLKRVPSVDCVGDRGKGVWTLCFELASSIFNERATNCLEGTPTTTTPTVFGMCQGDQRLFQIDNHCCNTRM